MNSFKFLNIIRYNDWWLYKVPPLLSVMYATLYLHNYCISFFWLEILKLIFYISSAAIYVCIINDFTDRKIDLIAGKKNVFNKFSAWVAQFILISTILLQILVLFSLRNNGVSAYWYFLSIFSYSLYSIPPIRLKEDKYFGILTDALGAHSFASVFIVMYVYNLIKIEPNYNWVVAVFVWSFTYGVRGIVWHQFIDKEADCKVGINTFANSLNTKKLSNLVISFFIIEFLTLLYLLLFLSSWLLIVAFLLYLMVTIARHFVYSSKIILAIPNSSFYQILLAEFYELYLPLSILLLNLTTCKSVLFIITIQLVLFPKRLFTLYVESKDIYIRVRNYIFK